MKVTKKVSAIAAVVGVCILATTSFAVYNTGNGYDNLKKSILATAKYTNCTTDGKMSVSIDGASYTTDITSKFDAVNKKSYMLATDSYGSYSENYMSDGKIYSRGQSSENFTAYNEEFYKQNLWGVAKEDDEEYSKIVRFLELGLDTVVGDLKSNIVCTESNDEYTTYSLNLDYMQIPELVQAGLGVIGTSYNSYDVELDTSEMANIVNAPYLLGKDPVVNNFGMDYTINKDGTLRDGEMRIQFTGKDKNGESHTADVVLNVSFSDVGTTVVEPIDVSNAIDRS